MTPEPWVLVFISILAGPTEPVDAERNGTYGTMVECFDARDELLGFERPRSGTQALCLVDPHRAEENDDGHQRRD